MRKFSVRPTLTLRGRKFKGLRGWSGKPTHPPLTDFPVAAYVFAAVFDYLGSLGPIHVEPVGVGIFLNKRGSFVELRPKTKWVAMSFPMPRRVCHPRITRKPIETGMAIYHIANLRTPTTSTKISATYSPSPTTSPSEPPCRRRGLGLGRGSTSCSAVRN